MVPDAFSYTYYSFVKKVLIAECGLKCLEVNKLFINAFKVPPSHNL